MHSSTLARLLVALVVAVVVGGEAWGQTSFTSNAATGAWDTARWNNTANGPTYGVNYLANNNVSFTSGTYTFTGMGTSINVGNISLGNNVTVNFSDDTGMLATNGQVRTISLGSGAILDLNSQPISNAANTGFIVSGSGVFATGVYTSTPNALSFTLNSGTVIARGVNGFGNGSNSVLNLNGGVVASNATRTFGDTRHGGGINIGGNVQFGEVSSVVSLANNTANLSFANDVNLGGATRTLTVGNSGTQTFGGVVSNGGLTFAANANGSAGIFALGGDNTYSGGTSISGGTLLATNTAGSATGTNNVTVNNTGTLGGTGNVTGSINVNIGGTIRGGTVSGTGFLNTSNVSLNDGGILAANLGLVNATPLNSDSSRLNIGGSILDLATGSRLSLARLAGFNGTAGSYILATLTNGNTIRLNGSPSAEGDVFGVFTSTGGNAGTNSGAVAIDLTGFTLSAGNTFTLARGTTANGTANSLVLTFQPVPEPATVLAIGAAGLGLAGWVRRRRKAAVGG